MQKFSTQSLRDSIVADLAALRDGRLRSSEARTRAYLAKQIIDTLKVEAVAMQMRVEAFVPIALLPESEDPSPPAARLAA